MNCPICNSINIIQSVIKKGVSYQLCNDCETLFVPNGLPQDNMVGGDKEIERNTTQNLDRLSRFRDLVGGGTKILDYGCGHGYLVSDSKNHGFFSEGYDKFNEEYNKVVGKFDLVSLIEVIEHLHSPFDEIKEIYRLLNHNGILYIETSFTDIIDNFEDSEYVAPELGHCTIFSHKSLDMLMMGFKFTPLKHINDNVRIYQKTT